MIGITAYGAYVPWWRLKRERIGQAFGQKALPGERAVAGPDEDTVSMAVAASLDCLGWEVSETVDALYLATTTPPYGEKPAAPVVAAALDLRGDARTSDFAGTVRSGSGAFLAARDAVLAGTARRALMVASDSRLGMPQSQNEQIFGDGAAAFLFGAERVLATVDESYSLSGEILDTWRSPGDAFVRGWEERFAVSEGYNRMVEESVAGLLRKMGRKPDDFSKLVLNAVHPRQHAALAATLGFAPDRVQDNLFQHCGLAGTANGPMMLAAALETARPGDLLMYVTYGNGAEAIALSVTDNVDSFRPHKGVSGHIGQRSPELSYERYLKWRNLLATDAPRRPDSVPPSAPKLLRDVSKNLAFYGTRCAACGTPQYPAQRVCVYCQAKDQTEPYRFAGRRGRVTTYTIDHLARSIDPPTAITVVDFDGGGRIFLECCDCNPAEMAVGMPVELTFRHVDEVAGIHRYSWKARPAR